MESKELEVNRELRAIRNYGVFILVAFFVLNVAAFATLNFFETNDIRNELVTLSEKLPSPAATTTEQTIVLPENILSFQSSHPEHTGFYKTKIVGKEYLAYANPNKSYILMKSVDSITNESKNFGFSLLALYLGEIIIIFGWWTFVRTKVRELFEIE